MESESKVLVRGKDVPIGGDDHKESFRLTTRVKGTEVFHGNIPSQYHTLRKIVDQFPNCIIKVAYDAGPCEFWLFDRLSQDGIQTIVVPPSLIPVESENKVKMDKRDSCKLARLLGSNLLKRIYVFLEEDCANRELLRTRCQIVEHRNDVVR